MNSPKQTSNEALVIPLEPKKEQLKSQFKSKLLEQIPSVEIKLVYHKEVASKDRVKILGTEQAADIVRALWNPNTIELQEEFKVIYLNNHNQIIGLYPHSKGSITSTQADLRLILIGALQCGAVAILLAHNHPSSNINPSDIDKTITKKIQKASHLLDIALLDHLIISKYGYYSFAEEDELESYDDLPF